MRMLAVIIAVVVLQSVGEAARTDYPSTAPFVPYTEFPWMFSDIPPSAEARVRRIASAVRELDYADSVKAEVRRRDRVWAARRAGTMSAFGAIEERVSSASQTLDPLTKWGFLAARGRLLREVTPYWPRFRDGEFIELQELGWLRAGDSVERIVKGFGDPPALVEVSEWNPLVVDYGEAVLWYKTDRAVFVLDREGKLMRILLGIGE